MTSDLSDHLALKYNAEHVAKLEARIKRLELNNIELRSRYKALYNKHYPKARIVSRGDKVRLAIKELKENGHEGLIVDNIKRLAKQHHMAVSSVNRIWYGKQK